MMRVSEVAEVLQVSASNVYALIEAGKLTCYRIGVGRGAIRISKHDFDAYLMTTRRNEYDSGASTKEVPPPDG